MKKLLTAILFACLIHASFAQTTIYSRSTIKGWLTTGARPTQDQYWRWLDSYDHKADSINMLRIPGLTTALNSANAISLSLVDSLKKNTAIAYMRATVADPVRGGNFIARNETDGFVIDSGIVFKSANTGIVWVRDISQTQAINLKWFGAKGAGISSVHEDSLALWNAIAYLKRNGGGALYVPNTSAYYAFDGYFIPLPDHVEIYGDGKGKSDIRHINPQLNGGGFFQGTIFGLSTFSTTGTSGINRCRMDSVYNALPGQKFVKLKTISDAARFHADEMVIVAANVFWKEDTAAVNPIISGGQITGGTVIKGGTGFSSTNLPTLVIVGDGTGATGTVNVGIGGDITGVNITNQGTGYTTATFYFVRPVNTGKAIYAHTDECLITSISRDTLFFEKPLLDSFISANGGGSARVIELNASLTTNPTSGYVDQVAHDVSIHDLTLSQSETNMRTGAKYDTSKPAPMGQIQMGQYDGRFYNLKMVGYGGLGGNLVSGEIYNITLISAKKMLDLGYSSSDLKIKDVSWTYTNNFGDTTETALLYINNASHHIIINGVSLNAVGVHNNVIQIAGGAHDISINNCNLDDPDFITSVYDVIKIKDDDTVSVYPRYSYNISITNSSFVVDTCDSFLKFIGWTKRPPGGFIKLSNLNFYGVTSNSLETNLNNAGAVSADNIFLPDNALIKTTGNSTVINPLRVANAPTKLRLNTNFVTTSGSPQSVGLAYNVIAGTKYTVRVRLEINCSTANGVKIAVNCSGSPIIDNGFVYGANSAINNTKYAFLPDLAGTNAGTWANIISTHLPAFIDLSFTAGSNGTLNIQACAGTSGDVATVYAGSWMEVLTDQ